MNFSDNTKTLLDAVESTSGKPLPHREHVGLLIECAVRKQAMTTLDELSFQAKFVHRTFAIMQRIGPNAEGYDKLSTEVGESVEKSKVMINELLSASDEASRKEFESVFFAMAPSAFRELHELFHALSWYKNYLIDTRKG